MGRSSDLPEGLRSAPRAGACSGKRAKPSSYSRASQRSTLCCRGIVASQPSPPKGTARRGSTAGCTATHAPGAEEATAVAPADALREVRGPTAAQARERVVRIITPTKTAVAAALRAPTPSARTATSRTGAEVPDPINAPSPSTADCVAVLAARHGQSPSTTAALQRPYCVTVQIQWA